MKKIKGFLCILVCILLTSGITPVFADNTSRRFDLNNTSLSMNELTPYIKVINNNYVLELPKDISLSDDLKFKVESVLKMSNKTINERGLTIDPISKQAYEIYGFRSANSKNYTGLSWNWNYVRVYLDSKIFASLFSLSGNALVEGAKKAAERAGFAGFWINVGAFAIKLVVGYVSTSYPNGIYIDLNYFGLASCGIGAFTGGVFGIAAAVPISILLSWQVNACGLSFGSQ